MTEYDYQLLVIRARIRDIVSQMSDDPTSIVYTAEELLRVADELRAMIVPRPLHVVF